jgi:hypothetical protein
VGTRSRPRQYYLDDALFHPAVSTTAGGVRSWDLCPGQVFSWLCRGGLVAFLCEHVVGATPQHEVVGMAFLLQSVRCNDSIGEVANTVAQRRKLGDLVSLTGHVDLAKDDLDAVVDRGQQMPRQVV